MSSKYNNTKIEIDGIKFASKKEYSRYKTLKTSLDAGEIANLVLQPKFLLQDKFNKSDTHYRAIYYIADFMYETSEGNTVVEDVKSSSKFKTDVYKLKRKLFEAKYPNLTIVEIY